MRKAREDLERRIQDDQVAREIMRIPEEEWEESGEFFSKPFGEGSSSSSASAKSVEGESVFRLYFKGLVSEERVGKERAALAGIGVALCDPRDNLLFEVRKPLIGSGTSSSGAQLKALIEGLNAALALDLKRLTFFCENRHIFQFITGKWTAKQRKVAMLVSQVKSLQAKFTVCNPILVPRFDIKFAFKLARDAIDSQSQTNQPAQSITSKNVNETCVICLEATDVNQMFSVDGCLHRYCFSCMKQHVEVKLLHGMIPRCPHEDCKSDLTVDSCAKFLTPKHVETMRQRIKEASIPATEKVYCPYPRCSALMSKRELLQDVKSRDVELSGVRKCLKCQCLFCINCKVPWHRNRTCADYKRLNPHPPEDTKLKSLASTNLWRQCVKCNHMIELAEGCYHMTCRCGHEFCYNCGGEWKDKKATCSCPLWDEGNILHDEDDEDFDFDEEDVSESDSEGHAPGFCNDCGQSTDYTGACLHPVLFEDDILFDGDSDTQELKKDEYEGEVKDDGLEEDGYEDEIGQEVQEEMHILPAVDGRDLDEEIDEDEEFCDSDCECYEDEVHEKEVREDVQEEWLEQGQVDENFYAENDTDFGDEYEEDEEECCDSDCGRDCDCYDSNSDYY
ncbi:E3 ubiquitin-protein ligase RSL1-like isoform X3 [Malus sylvestris]|uniref:E3 ubiquitin-protein ligase RSL1-like isoform X3 n=1 Tax=Malus sylvestris TaxID=3752 RepID=UPI0021ACB53B|nr:E3 ubiquitin-protein ligase RSL1-like isoform X3 [Malus sylvestris]